MHTVVAEIEDEVAVEVPAAETVVLLPDTIARQDPAKAPEAETSASSELILRFQTAERLLHWAIAIPFMICAASGLILLAFFNLHSTGISRDIISWGHRIAGLGLMIFPPLSILLNLRGYRMHLKNVRHACTWTLNDLRWVILFAPAAINSRIKLPDQHKFNAAEKVNFIFGLCSYPLFLLTGAILWLPETNFVVWMIHVGVALFALPLIVGHIYMALINPSTRPGLSGMFSGYVDRLWAKHHYGVWYRETFGAEEDPGKMPGTAH